jgi:RNA polymerase sigma-70 factor, ECF subfamily
MTSVQVPPAESDGEMIRRVLAGDRDAYAGLVRRHERYVHAAAWAIVRDHHWAQDVTQDTFLKGYDELASLHRPAAFGAWLLTIVRRQAIDHARRKDRLIFVPAVPEVQTSDAPGEEEDAARILDAVARLSIHEQQVVMLRYFQGAGVAEIAALLGSPVGTVTKQLSRALTRLRGRLKELP